MADLAGNLRGEAAMAGESRRDVCPCEKLLFEAGDAGFDHMAGLPQPRALVHVLVQPLVAGGEMELVHQAGEPGVDGPEKANDPLEELRRHEALRLKQTVEVVEAVGEKGVEGTDSGGRIHGGK